MAERSMTSHDVARLAGVSQSAVSRAFTPGGKVSAAMREKVMAAARELGYQPNFLPRMMLHGKTGIVAVVVGGSYNPFHAATLDAFSHALRRAGKQVMLVQSESDRALDEVVADLAGYRIDGVVSALSILSQDSADAISAHRIPVVTLNSGITSDYIHVVETDNFGAGETAARLMLEGGGTRFAFAGADSIASRARQAGFCAALAKAGIAAPYCLTGTLDHDGGYAIGQELLAAPERPDSIFCVNDLTAIGIVEAFRMEGELEAPDNFQIVGFDDIPSARWPSYDLTTFNQNVDAMAARAVALLEDDPAGRRPPTRVDFTLIRRGTTLTMEPLPASGNVHQSKRIRS